MVAMLLIPRLPTPIAMYAPGLRFAPMPDPDNSSRTVPGMSRRARSGKFCLTSSIFENWSAGTFMNGIIIAVSTALPLVGTQARVLLGRVDVKNAGVRVEFAEGPQVLITDVGVVREPMIVVQKN